MSNIIFHDNPPDDQPVEILRSSDEFDETQQNFRYRTTTRKDNFAISHVSVQDTEQGGSIICVEKEISRPFRGNGESFGRFGTVYRLETYTPEKFVASMTDILDAKADITALSYDRNIPSYAPETDVHHVNQKVYFQENAAMLLAEQGVSVDTGFAEDFRSLESVDVMKGQMDAIETAHHVKEDYRLLYRQFTRLEETIEREINQGLTGLNRIRFRNLPDAEKIALIPGHYQVEWSDLYGRLNQLWEIAFSAKREVVGENFKRMTIPESVSVDEDAIVERNMNLTLHDSGVENNILDDIDIDYWY